MRDPSGGHFLAEGGMAMMHLLWLIPAGAILSASPDPAQQPQSPSKPRRVEVWLGGPVNKIKGFNWTSYGAGKLMPFTGEPGPHKITVHLPSGRRFKGWSSYLLLSQEAGTVTEVTFSPLPGYGTFHK